MVTGLDGGAARVWRGSVASEREGRFGPDGLGVGVPTMTPVVAVGGLAGDAESVADHGGWRNNAGLCDNIQMSYSSLESVVLIDDISR